MKAITLRNIPPELYKRIKKKVIEDGISANKIVLQLLDESQRIRKKKHRQRYHDLDALAGSWTEREATAFEKALRKQRHIDRGIWK